MRFDFTSRVHLTALVTALGGEVSFHGFGTTEEARRRIEVQVRLRGKVRQFVREILPMDSGIAWMEALQNDLVSEATVGVLDSLLEEPAAKAAHSAPVNATEDPVDDVYRWLSNFHDKKTLETAVFLVGLDAKIPREAIMHAWKRRASEIRAPLAPTYDLCWEQHRRVGASPSTEDDTGFGGFGRTKTWHEVHIVRTNADLQNMAICGHVMLAVEIKRRDHFGDVALIAPLLERAALEGQDLCQKCQAAVMPEPATIG